MPCAIKRSLSVQFETEQQSQHFLWSPSGQLTDKRHILTGRSLPLATYVSVCVRTIVLGKEATAAFLGENKKQWTLNEAVEWRQHSGYFCQNIRIFCIAQITSIFLRNSSEYLVNFWHQLSQFRIDTTHTKTRFLWTPHCLVCKFITSQHITIGTRGVCMCRRDGWIATRLRTKLLQKLLISQILFMADFASLPYG